MDEHSVPLDYKEMAALLGEEFGDGAAALVQAADLVIAAAEQGVSAELPEGVANALVQAAEMLARKQGNYVCPRCGSTRQGETTCMGFLRHPSMDPNSSSCADCGEETSHLGDWWVRPAEDALQAQLATPDVCTWGDCAEPSKWTPVVHLRRRHELAYSEAAFPNVAVCNEHKENVASAHLINDAGWEQILEMYRQADERSPDRLLCTIAWTEVVADVDVNAGGG